MENNIELANNGNFNLTCEWNGKVTIQLDRKKHYNIENAICNGRKCLLIIEAPTTPNVKKPQPIVEDKSLVKTLIDYLRLKSGIGNLKWR